MVQNPRNKKLYRKVRELRRKGLSYRNIEKKYNISKSNISLWCRDIILSPEQTRILIGNRINNLKLASERLHEIREEEIKKVKDEAEKYISFKKLDDFTFLVAGSVIYWAEGTKSNGLSIYNSDERMILFMIKWFEKFFGVEQNRLKAYLHIHKGNNDEKIKIYWSKLTGIPLSNFGKSFIKPKGTGHRKNKLPYGIIKISVIGKGATDMRIKTMAWVEKISKIVVD